MDAVYSNFQIIDLIQESINEMEEIEAKLLIEENETTKAELLIKLQSVKDSISENDYELLRNYDNIQKEYDDLLKEYNEHEGGK